VQSCVGRGLETVRALVQGALPTVEKNGFEISHKKVAYVLQEVWSLDKGKKEWIVSNGMTCIGVLIFMKMHKFSTVITEVRHTQIQAYHKPVSSCKIKQVTSTNHFIYQ
jgi:hypothetical protein